MYQNILNQIANTLVINIQYQKSNGLLDGKIGIVLFLYNYAYFTENKAYSELAGKLLDQVYENLSKYDDRDFFNGLAGIAYGVDYIINSKFVEADESDGDIFEEIDSVLSQMGEETFLLELENDFSIFSKGLYFLQRKNKYSLSKIAEECLIFLTSQKREIPLSYINSIFYFINKALQLEEINRNLTNEILDILFTQTVKILSENDCDQSDIYALYRNIKNISESEIRNRWLKLPLYEYYDSISILDKSWIHLIYKYDNDEAYFIDKSKMQELIKNTIQDLIHENLTLYKGLSGLGLELIRLSKN